MWAPKKVPNYFDPKISHFRMHYNGKLHDKKARMFLNQWSLENQRPAPQKKAASAPNSGTDSSDSSQAPEPRVSECGGYYYY